MTINHLSLSFIIIPAVLCSQQVKLLRIVLTQLGVKLISRLDEALESFNFISQSSICSSTVVWDSIIVKSNNSIFLRELHYKCVMILKVLNILLLVYKMGSHAGKNQQQCPWAKKKKKHLGEYVCATISEKTLWHSPLPDLHCPGPSTPRLAWQGQGCSWGFWSRQWRHVWRSDQSRTPTSPGSCPPFLGMESGGQKAVFPFNAPVGNDLTISTPCSGGRTRAAHTATFAWSSQLPPLMTCSLSSLTLTRENISL